jgi:hypothetical protein
MMDAQKTLERQELLRRHGELQAEIAQHERNLREGEARLPLEEQLTLFLRRLTRDPRARISKYSFNESW